MPDYVARHENPAVLPYLLSVAEGASVDEAVAALGEGWSLDEKSDPANVVPPSAPPAEPVQTETASADLEFPKE